MDSNLHFSAQTPLPGGYSRQATIYWCTLAKSNHNFVKYSTRYPLIPLGGVEQSVSAMAGFYTLNLLIVTPVTQP